MPPMLDVPHMPELIYTAQSKRFFYCRDAVVEYVLRTDNVPLNPFRMFGYFLGERVERDVVRRANAMALARADELWVFGAEIANGVFEELRLARQWGKPVKFFSIGATLGEIAAIGVADLSFEAELVADVYGDIDWLRAQLTV